jgi:hypothetical protein
MSETPNPYGTDLGELDARVALRQTPTAIVRVVDSMGNAGLLRRLGPEKWTAAQILVHLAQVETMFQSRLRLGLALPGVVVQPFDQNDFMRTGGTTDGLAALDAYVSLRRFTLPLIEGLTEAELATPVRHPDFGDISIGWILAWCAGHERRHLAQLEQIAAQD